MSINLGNVVGLLRSETPPTKKYVVWAKVLNPTYPDIVELHYWDELNSTWTPVTDPTTQHWLRPVINILADPPGAPVEGDRYLIAASGTSGAWIGKEDKVAAYKSGAWQYQTPLDGYIVSNRAEVNKLYDYRGVWGSGGAWFENDFQVPVAPGTYIPSTEKGANNGVAELDGDAFIEVSQINPDTLPFNPTVPTSWPAGTDTIKEAIEYLRTMLGIVVENPVLLRGYYDASSNAWPTAGGTGVGGVPAVGNQWVISVAGNLPGKGDVEPGAKIMYLGSSVWDVTY